jgi:hypothetical protein
LSGSSLAPMPELTTQGWRPAYRAGMTTLRTPIPLCRERLRSRSGCTCSTSAASGSNASSRRCLYCLVRRV